jgi:hypothetical protein
MPQPATRVTDGRGLSRVVVGAELGDEFSRVFGGVDGEGLGDHEEGGGEFGDGELFAGAL